jgi:heterodisulfide reductase subunit C
MLQLGNFCPMNYQASKMECVKPVNNETIIQFVRKVAVRFGYRTEIWLSVSKLPLKCAVVV